MKRWTILAIVALGMAFPIRAADEPKGEQKETSEEVTNKKDQKEESPILRMAELRLDEYVVPARMINLPVPGRTRTVQEILDRFKKWSEDEKIGAVLMDVGRLRRAMVAT